ncbi:glycoside hydrolase family 19 protein [Albimonas pacifica]|uniref:Chitinase class I n=1 Tax=Albimonas pacifica TaxID=1114924 RepID=A0A1I3JHY9_9RHOB|nr:glycoside hydrolase family 19 protein [Albimonas pacifica]SFI59784.1 Chitinase class I [Albimonas pacifica]
MTTHAIDFDALGAFVMPRLFRGSLPPKQAAPLRLLIEQGLGRGKGLRKTAYVLATAYHETVRFLHMEEIGRGAGKAYGEDLPLMGTGSRVDQRRRYHGRGFVQLTWLRNYADMSVRLGLDLVSNPDLVKSPEIASEVIWEGMLEGVFGDRLSQHVRPGHLDFRNARRCVNGLDRADDVAGYAGVFLEGLRASLSPSV